MGSEETLQEYALHVQDTEQHNELLDALIHSQNQEHEGGVAFQYNCISASHLRYKIYNASGEQWGDYEI